jgi:signal transduction histidine kinase
MTLDPGDEDPVLRRKARMRYDDMLGTVLAQPRNTVAARIALWRQLVDVLAQREDIALNSEHIEAFAMLEEWRSDIPQDVRLAAANSLAGRAIPSWLFTLFSEDSPDVASPVVLKSHLDTEDWLDILPEMRPSSRALLRHRKDLDDEVVQALGHFGAADLILETSSMGAEADDPDILELEASAILLDDPDNTEQSQEQIRNLVERIEAFRRDRPKPIGATGEASGPAAMLSEFKFEAGPDGVIHWVDGAPRGPLIGQTIGFRADALEFGVDGHAAGAFRQRAPFRDARLVVAGEGPASGSWRISAVPFFNEQDGRFAGYRGMARRPRRGDEASVTGSRAQGLFGSNLEPDALRQLIHELRTPLNAITGFAEMIEGQLLGPVSVGYRERASAIAGEASRLLQSVEDLDTAARAETDRLTLDPETIDVAALLERLHDEFVRQAESRNVALAIRIDRDLPYLAADPIAVERMLERLLSATVGLSAAGETIAVNCTSEAEAGTVAIAFSRPALLEGQPETDLLDPGFSPDGDWPDAPALGLGFALRLIRNIAREVNGQLAIEPQDFVLHLPSKDASALPGERGQ